MTIDYEKLREETSYSLLDESNTLLILSLNGGELDESIIEFSDINLNLDENNKVGIDFDYEIKSDKDIVIEENEELQVFLTNLLMTYIGDAISQGKQ